MPRSKEKLSGITYHPERILQPYTVWRKGSIVHFCEIYSDAEVWLKFHEPHTLKVPTPLPVPLPLHGDNGGKNKEGSHHRRFYQEGYHHDL